MEPKIDKNWFTNHGTYIKLALVILAMVVVGLFVFHGCNDLGKQASGDVYTPDDESGFIHRSNELLQRLVEEGNKRAPEMCKSIADLNKKYPALRFALPYDADKMMGGRADDIRLVDIIVDSIHDDEMRSFFNNSNLASLLKKQRESLGSRLFRIKFASDTSGIRVRRISLIASMFRVALERDPWRSTILAHENAMFAEDNHCFVSYGGSVVPLRKGSVVMPTNNNTQTVYVLDREHLLSASSTRTVKVNWLDMDEQFETRPLLNLVFNVASKNKYSESLKLGFDGDSLLVRVEGPTGFTCRPYYVGADEKSIISSAGSNAQAMTRLPINTGDVKLVVTCVDGTRSELTVSRHNPMLTLSQPMHTNSGLSRYNVPLSMTDRFSYQVVRGLNNALRNTTYDSAQIQLSIDPLLSMTMEQMLEKYYKDKLSNAYPRNGRGKNEFELSVTVMDMATGQVLAAPYYSTADIGLSEDVAMERKNPALVRRYIGSTFKPLLATAAALTCTDLANYTPSATDFSRSGDDCTLFGKPVAKWAPAGHWNTSTNMTRFFTNSEDVYPVALAMRAMCANDMNNGYKGVFDTRGGKWALPKSGADVTNFANNPFFQTVSSLYNVKSWDATVIDEDDFFDMSQYIWRDLHLSDDRTFAMEIVNPDMVNMAYELMCREATVKEGLVPWVLGQGNNEWNTVKLAEAWSRMLTKRALSASLVYGDSMVSVPLITDAEGKSYSNVAWNAVLQSLVEAQSGGKLLPPVYNRVQRLNAALNDNSKLVLFGKTGTPDNYSRIEGLPVERTRTQIDAGLYCMALMPQHAVSRVRSGATGTVNGIMVVVRVTRLSPPDKGNGIGSSHARDFLLNDNNLENLYRLTRQYLQ